MYAKEADLNKSTCMRNPNTITMSMSFYTLAKIINHTECGFLRITEKLGFYIEDYSRKSSIQSYLSLGQA